MNQNKDAPSTINVKKTLIFMAIITGALVLLLKVIKETNRTPEPIPLVSPLPDSETLAAPPPSTNRGTEASQEN